MESFASLIKQRRSTRKFTEEPLTPEQVEAILKAGLMAPSSKRSNPWQFIVVEDKEMLQKLAHCKNGGSAFLEGCSLAVVVCADVMASDVWVEDASVAATYIQLQAELLGLGSCWVQIRGRFDKDNNDAADLLRALLNIPGEQQVECVITLGHKDEVRRPVDPEKLLWEKVHIGKF